MYDAIHGWMMGQMDGWMENFILSTTSFTICITQKQYILYVCIEFIHVQIFYFSKSFKI